MVAMRPGPDSTWQHTLYVNHADATWTTAETIYVKSGGRRSYRINVYETTVQMYDAVTASVHVVEASIRGPIRTNVGPWFGGNRTAPQPITLYSEIR